MNALRRFRGGRLLLTAPVLLLAVLLVAAALAACGGNGAPDADDERETERQEAGDRDRSDTGEAEDGRPEPTRRGLPGRIGTQATEGPDATRASASLLPTPAVPPCPPRTADGSALLSSAQTSAGTDQEALLAIFDATDGEVWDTGGGRSSPIPTKAPEPTRILQAEEAPQPSPTPAPVMGTVGGN